MLREHVGAFRIFIFWFPRELNTMCDAGSKGLMTVVADQLRARGLPPLAPTPLSVPVAIRLSAPPEPASPIPVPTGSDHWSQRE